LLGCRQEYEGLTNKIHDLQMREQQLHEVLFDYHHAPGAPADSADELPIVDGGQQSPGAAAAADMPLSHASTTHDDDCATSSCGKMQRSIVRAHLPKKMTTAVSPLTYLIVVDLPMWSSV